MLTSLRKTAIASIGSLALGLAVVSFSTPSSAAPRGHGGGHGGFHGASAFHGGGRGAHFAGGGGRHYRGGYGGGYYGGGYYGGDYYGNCGYYGADYYGRYCGPGPGPAIIGSILGGVFGAY